MHRVQLLNSQIILSASHWTSFVVLAIPDEDAGAETVFLWTVPLIWIAEAEAGVDSEAVDVKLFIADEAGVFMSDFGTTITLEAASVVTNFGMADRATGKLTAAELAMGMYTGMTWPDGELIFTWA